MIDKLGKKSLSFANGSLGEKVEEKMVDFLKI